MISVIYPNKNKGGSMEVSTEFIQKESYEILKVFHIICEKENLKYILDYGTLLGAVRHDGFIPWDDDLDVSMPRDDYEKFLAVAEKYLPENMSIQNYKTDPNYLVPFTKIRKTDTYVQELELNMYNIKKGVWLDIFVYDNVCEEKDLELAKLKKLNKERNYYQYAFPVIFEKDKKLFNLPKTFIKLVMIWLLKMAHKKDNSLLLKFLRSKQLAFIETAKNTCENKSLTKMRCYKLKNHLDLSENLLNVEAFENRILKRFENDSFYIPENYEEILFTRYGDYTKLPPKEERKQTHRWTRDIQYL